MYIWAPNVNFCDLGALWTLYKWFSPICSPLHIQHTWSCPFCRDCWEEEGGCRGLDCVQEGIGRATLKKATRPDPFPHITSTGTSASLRFDKTFVSSLAL